MIAALLALVDKWKGALAGALSFVAIAAGALFVAKRKGEAEGKAKQEGAQLAEREKARGEIHALETKVTEREAGRTEAVAKAEADIQARLDQTLAQPATDKDAERKLAEAKARWLAAQK